MVEMGEIKIEQLKEEYLAFDISNRSVHDIFLKYLEMDPRKGIPFLIIQAEKLLNAKRFEDGIELLNMGHTVADKSILQKENNPYVTYGMDKSLYCWVCNKFKMGAKGELIVTRCKYCNKTFCKEHAKKSVFLFGAKCPICEK